MLHATVGAWCYRKVPICTPIRDWLRAYNIILPMRSFGNSNFSAEDHRGVSAGTEELGLVPTKLDDGAIPVWPDPLVAVQRPATGPTFGRPVPRRSGVRGATETCSVGVRWKHPHADTNRTRRSRHPQHPAAKRQQEGSPAPTHCYRLPTVNLLPPSHTFAGNLPPPACRQRLVTITF